MGVSSLSTLQIMPLNPCRSAKALIFRRSQFSLHKTLDIVLEPVSNNITRCIPLWCHHRSARNEFETQIKHLTFGKGEVLLLNVLQVIRYVSMMYDQSKVLRPGLSKNVFSPSSPFIHTYPPHRILSLNVPYNHLKTFYYHNPIYISDPCSIYGCFFLFVSFLSITHHFCSPSLPAVFSLCRHRPIGHPPAHLNISPLLPRFPSLFQSTCDTLRSHSDSLGFAPNVLPSHPTLGSFEEFAC